MNKCTTAPYADFTMADYERLLYLALGKYQFCSFNDFRNKDSFIIWRHDVDMSPHRAAAFAKIEYQLGVRATYFINLHSDYYNLFEQQTGEIIREIVRLGHHIGLHFDHLACRSESYADATKVMLKERKLLESYFETPIRSFSFHLTNDFSFNADKETYAGMQNATSRYFREQVKYCSDSTGVWRYDRLEDVLLSGEHKRLQVLTHPCMWQDSPMSPRDRYKRCIYGRADSNWKRTQELLAEFGQKLVGEE